MNELTAAPALAATKQHFEILDGLRGIAAVAVVIFHFMEIAVPDYNDSFIPHAYLAVDFFFCLSGFVIAYAYDQRLFKLGAGNFLKLRLIRLHPLVITGSVIGLLVFVFDPFSSLYRKYLQDLAALFLTSCVMAPYPLVHERYFNLFHLNPPTWSLFWEYIANICYAFFLIRLPNKFLWVLTLIAALALVYEARRSGYLGVGWGGDNIIGGGIRVFYSFLAGLLLYRLGWIIASRINFVTISILLLGAFLVPFSKDANRIIDPFIAIFYFPFLVALGAGARLKSSLKRICNFSGAISYPLYMVHYPFIWLFMSYVESHKPSIQQMSGIIVLGVMLLIAFAYLVMILIDIPIRKWLKASLLTERGV